MRCTLAFGLLLLLASPAARAETPINYSYGLDSTSRALAMANKPTGAMSNPGAMSNTVAAADEGDCGCDECKKHGGLGGRGGRGGSQRRSVDWGNCNCNGSYKFPVPPLYTYQWPGRYSQQLMTDYHSPWRFPPLRPYVDEPVGMRGMNTRSVTPTSAEEEIAGDTGETAARSYAPESLSAKIERYYGVKQPKPVFGVWLGPLYDTAAAKDVRRATVIEQDAPTMPKISTAPRILIVRLSAIGDVVHGLPVLNALRAHFPDAFLGWVVEGRAADLLRGHAALDRLIQMPRKWLKSPRAVWSLRQELRELKFDIALDLQCLTKSAIAAWLSGAKRRIGFAGADGRELSRFLHNEHVTPTAAHVIDKNLELLRPLGIDRPRAEFNLPETPADAATAERIIQTAGLNGGFAIVNPGAGWPSKRWPLDRYAEVARHLSEHHDLPSLVVWAGPEERGWAEQIVAASSGTAQLAPATTLTELAALARRATMFIGSDTGPLHIAAAVGTPCVGLYGPMPRERNGPYGPHHIALQEVWLSGSSRERRTPDASSMEAISAESVCAACDTIVLRATQDKRRIA